MAAPRLALESDSLVPPPAFTTAALASDGAIVYIPPFAAPITSGFVGTLVISGGQGSLSALDGEPGSQVGGPPSCQVVSCSTSCPWSGPRCAVPLCPTPRRPGQSPAWFPFPIHQPQVGPKCEPGSGGILCHVCPAGSYKATYDNLPCVLCTNKPAKATYTTSGATNASCPYQCNPGYSMPSCKSAVQTLMDDFGGVVGFVVALVGLVVVVLCCVGVVTRIRYLKERQQVRVRVGGCVAG